jgi:pimeloyl-ACP methyl ester carboxylesterase
MKMKTLRKYGHKPFRVAVIHGGPGAPGEMAPVARELSPVMGVLEPLQTAATLEGQIRELKSVLQKNAALPVTLIGFSWGALLSFVFAARHPTFVRKLILIGSPPYEEKYAANITQTRLDRLSKKERAQALTLMQMLNDPSLTNKNETMAQLGELLSKADSYEPLPHNDDILECQYDVFQSVWEQAEQLRSSGKLLEPARKIKCPVVAIHGDYDPHPAAGVEEPLSRILRDFKFVLLQKCGHLPWLERSARGAFYNILNQELASQP